MTMTATEFLATRRSRPHRTLGMPAPDRAALEPLLQAGLRVPDHGKLEPWRLIVLERVAMVRLSRAVAACDAARGRSADDVAKQIAQWAGAPLAVAVVGTPRGSEAIPRIEQDLSAGAVCLSLLNAALAAGWGANWLSGWACHDPGFAAGLGVAAPDWIAGLIHIGTAGAVPPERPRPDLARAVTWVSS